MKMVFKKGHKINLGRNCSNEVKKKISESLKGANNPSKRIEVRKKNSEAHIGSKNHNWKGGRIINQKGYVLIYSKKGSYIREHRLVMEKHLGRKLTKEEVVHHIDNNKSNNIIENLHLFPNDIEHRNYEKV